MKTRRGNKVLKSCLYFFYSYTTTNKGKTCKIAETNVLRCSQTSFDRRKQIEERVKERMRDLSISEIVSLA